MAGFSNRVRDMTDEALYNWALWYKRLNTGALPARDDGGGGGGAGQGYDQMLTVVSVIEGLALDVDKDLDLVQQRIVERGANWWARQYVASWYAGTGTDSYEANLLKVSVSTFSDRIVQVKRHISIIKEARLYRKGVLRL